MKKHMKKIIAIVISLILILSLTYLIIDYNHKYNLVVEVNMVDEKSPDRILKVYDNDKEIKFKRIEYLDGVNLCSYEVPAVNFIDIKNEKKLVVVVKYGRKVEATIKEIEG